MEIAKAANHAATLLRSGKANCTEAAFAAGFNDSNYFSYSFRKLTGLAPTEYRKKPPVLLSA